MSEPIIDLKKHQAHDERLALEWWDKASPTVKKDVWDLIQTDFQKGGIVAVGGKMLEIMSRFAQVGYTHIALLAEKRKEAN